jgi:5-methylcytosine-specific restriction protein A
MSRRCLLYGPRCSDGGYALPGASRCRAHSRSGWGRRPPANAYAYSSGWSERRRQVLERDGYRCQLRYNVCVGRASQVDHIVQPEAGGTDALENLRAVCRPCHARRTGRQGAMAKQAKAQRRRVITGKENET